MTAATSTKRNTEARRSDGREDEKKPGDGHEEDEDDEKMDGKSSNFYSGKVLFLLSYVKPLMRMASHGKQQYFPVQYKGGAVRTQVEVAKKWLHKIEGDLGTRCAVTIGEDGRYWDFPDEEALYQCVDMGPRGDRIGPGAGKDFVFHGDAKVNGFPLVQLHVLPDYTLLDCCTSCGFISARQRNKNYDFEENLRGHKVCKICHRVFGDAPASVLPSAPRSPTKCYHNDRRGRAGASGTGNKRLELADLEERNEALRLASDSNGGIQRSKRAHRWTFLEGEAVMRMDLVKGGKFLPFAVEKKVETQEEFDRELEVVKRLSANRDYGHENIIALFSRDAKSLCFRYEYGGITLRTLLLKERTFAKSVLHGLWVQFRRAFTRCTERAVLHMDYKLENYVVRKVFITDSTENHLQGLDNVVAEEKHRDRKKAEEATGRKSNDKAENNSKEVSEKQRNVKRMSKFFSEKEDPDCEAAEKCPFRLQVIDLGSARIVNDATALDARKDICATWPYYGRSFAAARSEIEKKLKRGEELQEADFLVPAKILREHDCFTAALVDFFLANAHADEDERREAGPGGDPSQIPPSSAMGLEKGAIETESNTTGDGHEVGRLLVAIGENLEENWPKEDYKKENSAFFTFVKEYASWRYSLVDSVSSFTKLQNEINIELRKAGVFL
ncbi:unnamed protein product [Amoebophrya sp. A120]|nr:unnamed protein product [Amoebophrya sp. A120]|eukprot:GSA120T00025712001.1